MSSNKIASRFYITPAGGRLCRSQREFPVLMNTDGFVKNLKPASFVIPILDLVRDDGAGIHYFKDLHKNWTPFFNGVTTFYETIRFTSLKENDTAPAGRSYPRPACRKTCSGIRIYPLQAAREAKTC